MSEGGCATYVYFESHPLMKVSPRARPIFAYASATAASVMLGVSKNCRWGSFVVTRQGPFFMTRIDPIESAQVHMRPIAKFESNL
jgi:hypothetical protein